MEGAEAVHLARQLGVGATFLGGPAMGDRALVRVGGAEAEGVVYLAAALAGPDLAGAEAFVADYRSLAGQEPGSRATLAYEAANLLLEAISQAADRSPGRPTRSKVRAQLAGGFQHEGLLGRMTFGADGEAADWQVAFYRVEAGSYLGQRLR
jgi:branched-chain amino acid transport system substrate-binding protein